MAPGPPAQARPHPGLFPARSRACPRREFLLGDTLPTQAKIDRVDELKDKLERCSIIVTANYTGLTVNEVTELRRQMRGASIEFTVVKNNLMKLACDAADRPSGKEIVEGPTAVAFGYEQPEAVARALTEYIRSSRSALEIRGALLGPDQALTAGEVNRLATLPPQSQLVANLLGQMQAPLQRLMGAMNAPLQGLGGLLKARMEQLESGQPAA